VESKSDIIDPSICLHARFARLPFFA
jgi:hypothetical protein